MNKKILYVNLDRAIRESDYFKKDLAAYIRKSGAWFTMLLQGRTSLSVMSRHDIEIICRVLDKDEAWLFQKNK